MLSLITATYNKLEITRCFWDSLLKYPPSVDWEMIWVDDGSADETPAWLATLPALGGRHEDIVSPHPPSSVRVYYNKPKSSFAGSNNRGAKVATGEVLGFLNNDLVLTPGWFMPLWSAIDQYPQAGVVGNVQLNARTQEVDHSGVYYYSRGKPTHDRILSLSDSRLRPVIAATAACMLMRRDRFLQLGGFDEQFINGCEDVDLCLRARAAGWQNYVALDSVVYHHVSSSPGRSIHNQRNACLLMRRWRAIIPDLAAESWREVRLRDRWEAKLSGLAWVVARLTRRWHRRPDQSCPPWMRRRVARFVDRQLARWKRAFPEL